MLYHIRTSLQNRLELKMKMNMNMYEYGLSRFYFSLKQQDAPESIPFMLKFINTIRQTIKWQFILSPNP